MTFLEHAHEVGRSIATAWLLKMNDCVQKGGDRDALLADLFAGLQQEVESVIPRDCWDVQMHAAIHAGLLQEMTTHHEAIGRYILDTLPKIN